MRGPAGAFLLSALQLLCGTFLGMSLTLARWRAVDRGYFRSTTWVLWPLMAALAIALPRDLRWHAGAVAATWLLFLLAVYSQRPALEWGTATIGSVLGMWLVGNAGASACVPRCSYGLLISVGGALLLGAVTHAMVLGHWYLNQARLPIEPLKEASSAMLIAIVAALAVGVALREPLLVGSVPGGILAFSAESYWWTWLLLLAGTAGLWWMIRQTVRLRSTQSATGLLYLAIPFALASQFLLDLLVAT